MTGPILGAFLLTPLDVFLRAWLGGVSAGLNFIVYGLVLMVAVKYFPLGISGWVEQLVRPLSAEAPRRTERPGRRTGPRFRLRSAARPLERAQANGKSAGSSKSGP